MRLKRRLLTFLRRTLGTNQLASDMADLRAQLERIEQGSQVEVLPGTPYSRVAVPMEYPPSRDLRPRWGYGRPLLQPMVDWIQPHAEDYRAVLAAMSARAPQLAKINRDFDHDRLPEPGWLGGAYVAFDAAALYTLIGLHKPRLYLEIGSGLTTAFAWRSIRDHGLDTRIVSIDPAPRAAIDRICHQVVRAGLETCDLGVFDQLQPGDILFLDGSHRVFMNSDVTVFMLEVLPRLKPGVIVHVHDIHLPWDYHEMFTPWYWSEQYILASPIIAAPDRVRPILPTAWVCRRPEFAEWFANPPVDLGAENHAWRDGGALWFTPRG